MEIALDGLPIGISFAASDGQRSFDHCRLDTRSPVPRSGGRRGNHGSRVASADHWDHVCLRGALARWGGHRRAYFLSGVNGQALDAVMSFSVAALLYLVTEELLTEAHEVDETPLLTSMFFVGFVALLTIEMLVSSSDEVMLWHGVEASAAI
ncbi:MAG: hypothetical protein K0M68_21645 [Acidovorax sp.]|nr:hypothetical protein [Acidovorax sp.]